MAKKAAKARKYVYFFGGGKAEGSSAMKELLGGKGANLAEMSSLHLPVPSGFTITTETCAEFSKCDGKWPAGLNTQIERNIARLEKVTGKTFGRGANPLLVSVRSGAAVSMPGMMDTVLNLGLNDRTLKAMIELTGNERFVWDAYRRFMQMFGDVVLDMEHHHFEAALQAVKDAHGVKSGPAVRQVLEKAGNIAAVFQGHMHSGGYQKIAQIPYHTLPAMVEGPGLENNAYAVVTVQKSGKTKIERFGRQ